MRKLNSKFTLSLLIVGASLCLASTAGCKSSGKLEAGGAYAPATFTTGTDTNGNTITNVVQTAAPDKGLFVVDSSFDLAYAAVETVFNLERNNRALLWGISPDIKHTLDGLRPQVVDAIERYTKARRIYLTSPTPGGLTELQTILSQLQNAANAAQSVIPKSQTMVSPVRLERTQLALAF